MRWLPFYILAYLALGLQVGLGNYMAWHGATPNLVLIVVVYIALHTPRDAALLGCFLLGLLQDWLGPRPAGLYALSYGLVALFVVSSQQAIDRDHPLTHLVLALCGGLLTATILSVHAWLRPAGPGGHEPILTLFVSAGYTALLAPILIWPLRRFRRLFPSPSGHYRRR